MAVRSSNRHGLSPLKLFAALFVVLVPGVGGTLGVLWAAGLVDLPFLTKHKEPSHEGWVLAPMSGRLIPAFSMIYRDDLSNPETHLWNEQWIPQGALPDNAVTDRAKILGRVLNHDKAAGYVFTESDFMPVGTRSGVVAAIPPGKRSLTLESSKISGIHRLKMGDRFDIVGTLPLAKNQPAPQGRGVAALPRPKPEVLVLVRNGVVISSVSMRAQAATSQSLISGPRTTSKPVEEVMIALDPDEIPELTAAMGMDATITVVARSGHPDDAHINSVTPNSEQAPPPTAIETVIGVKRETIYFPGPKGDSGKLPDDGADPSVNLPLGLAKWAPRQVIAPRDSVQVYSAPGSGDSRRGSGRPRATAARPAAAMSSE